jgi:hypothetical protein
MSREKVSQRFHNNGRLVANVYRGLKDGPETFFYDFSGTGVDYRAAQITTVGGSKDKAQQLADEQAIRLFKEAGEAHTCSAATCGEWTDV